MAASPLARPPNPHACYDYITIYYVTYRISFIIQIHIIECALAYTHKLLSLMCPVVTIMLILFDFLLAAELRYTLCIPKH